jgi:methylaspartate ammonia-lyase
MAPPHDAQTFHDEQAVEAGADQGKQLYTGESAQSHYYRH